MFIASRPDGLRCMFVQRARRVLIGVVTTALLALGAVPIHVSAAASKPEASAIAALDAIPAADWLKQSSGALLDRVIAASSKASLDAAAARDPRAQALVGSAHLSGLHGYEKSEAKAVTFYRLAADSNPIAQNNLGNLLLSGAANGGTPAPAEAAEMFRRAAKQGHPVGQANIARLHIDGVGVEKDLAKAKEFLALAAAQGNAEAKTLLETLEARAVAEAEAARWQQLEQAAAANDANAQRELAKAYEDIAGKVLDAIKSNQLQLAVNTLLKARDPKKVPIAELADEHGMTALHWVVTNRNAAGLRWLLDKGVELEAKDDQGRTPFMIAVDNLDTRAMTLLMDRGAKTSTVLPGHDEALREFKQTSDRIDYLLNNLGVAYYEGKGVAKDPARSAKIFAVGCEANYTRACHNLALQLSTGEGLPKDPVRAVALYEKACAGGYAPACTNIGLRLFRGEGVAKDPVKAAVMYEKGCAGDDRFGCNNLGLMLDNGQGIPVDKPRAATLFAKACKLGDQKACARTAGAALAATTAAITAANTAANTAAPVTTAAATNCKLVNVVLGSDTVASVERDILRRGGTPSIGGNDRVNYRRLSSLSGDYSDGGPEIMAVNYDFDAGPPSGKLVTVTVVRKVAFGPPLNKLLADRKAYLTTAFGTLTSKSAKEFTGSRPGCTVALTGEPDTGYLYEVYSFAK